MAMDYNNIELVKNINKNLRPINKAATLTQLDEGVKVVIPSNSKNSPLYTRESYSDFLTNTGVQGENYIQHLHNTDSLAAATTATIATIPGEPGWYLLIHEFEVVMGGSGISTDEVDAWLSLGNAVNYPNQDVGFVGGISNKVSNETNVHHLSKSFRKPLEVYPGITIYFRARNSDAGAALNYSYHVVIEWRKIENPEFNG